MPKRRDNGTVLRREPAPQVSQADVRAAAQASATRAPEPKEAEPAPVARQSTTPDSATAGQPSGRPQPTRQQPTFHPSQPAQPAPAAQPARQPRQVQFDDDELDVPDFLK
jgi:cell division protein FtsZ